MKGQTVLQPTFLSVTCFLHTEKNNQGLIPAAWDDPTLTCGCLSDMLKSQHIGSAEYTEEPMNKGGDGLAITDINPVNPFFTEASPEVPEAMSPSAPSHATTSQEEVIDPPTQGS